MSGPPCKRPAILLEGGGGRLQLFAIGFFGNSLVGVFIRKHDETSLISQLRDRICRASVIKTRISTKFISYPKLRKMDALFSFSLSQLLITDIPSPFCSLSINMPVLGR